MDDDSARDLPTLDKTAAEIEALSLAIFALNTLQHPEASSPADLETLEERMDDVLDVLVRMRHQKRRTQRLFELVTGDGPVPCLCGHCSAAGRD